MRIFREIHIKRLKPDFCELKWCQHSGEDEEEEQIHSAFAKEYNDPYQPMIMRWRGSLICRNLTGPASSRRLKSHNLSL